MTVQQLIEELQKWPQDMPIAVYDDINWISKNIPDVIQVQNRVWVDNNYPYDKPDFLYINLE